MLVRDNFVCGDLMAENGFSWVEQRRTINWNDRQKKVLGFWQKKRAGRVAEVFLGLEEKSTIVEIYATENPGYRRQWVLVSAEFVHLDYVVKQIGGIY